MDYKLPSKIIWWDWFACIIFILILKGQDIVFIKLSIGSLKINLAYLPIMFSALKILLDIWKQKKDKDLIKEQIYEELEETRKDIIELISRAGSKFSEDLKEIKEITNPVIGGMFNNGKMGAFSRGTRSFFRILRSNKRNK